MITEVSIRCQKKPGGWYTPYTRVYPQYTTGSHVVLYDLNPEILLIKDRVYSVQYAMLRKQHRIVVASSFVARV